MQYPYLQAYLQVQRYDFLLKKCRWVIMYFFMFYDNHLYLLVLQHVKDLNDV